MLPPVDVRRKRPPALSFLLRMETLRTALARRRRCWRSTSPASSPRSVVALMVKAVLRDGDVGVGTRRCDEARDTIAFAYLVTVLLFARSGLYAERAPAARPAADRLLAVPGRRSSR